MRRLGMAVLVAVVFVPGCADGEDTDGDRGSATWTALAAGSCAGACGGEAAACWCDGACASYGDCCSDYEAVCVAGTCVGNCGGASEGACWCNAACEAHGDCCDDYVSVCDGADPSDPDLEARLRAEMSAGHVPLSYNAARNRMYGITGSIDVHGGVVEGVYTGATATADGTRTPGELNTEHVWPRSLTPSTTDGDLHNLRPALAQANNARGNYPFGETTCAGSACPYERGGSELGVDGSGARVWQVRPATRGDIARSKFYVAVRYGLDIPAAEETALRAWHEEDPPDARERTRVDAVEAAQGNRNVFVDRPELVDAIADF